MLQLIWTAGEFCSLGWSHGRESEAFMFYLSMRLLFFFGDHPYLESTTVLSDSDNICSS